MAYSKNKPYQRTAYRGAVDPSYDRYLKDAVNAGKAENIKESELEKPYNVKTYSTMQQEYNPVTPPVIDPGPGTGGLKCIWTSTDCEQLIGCWAGSDIVLEGPEAATAGYLPTTVIEGDIATETISGSEDRGLELLLDPSMRRNNLVVKFKDALGAIHEYPMDISCSQPNTWLGYDSSIAVAVNQRGSAIQSNGDLHITAVQTGTGLIHITWDGTSYSSETINSSGGNSTCVLDSSNYLHVAAEGPGNLIRYYTNTTGSWVSTDVYTGAAYPSSFSIMLDTSGYVHIISVIYDQTIVHSTNASGSWQTETVVSVAGTRYMDYASAIIKSDNTILIAFTANDYFPLPSMGYLRYITGTYGSWSAVTDIKSGDYYWDPPAICETTDGVIHILNTTSSLGLDEYYYNGGSWQERSISASYMRVPLIVNKGNLLSSITFLDTGLDYYPYEFVYDSGWSEPETVWYDLDGSFGPYQNNLIYDSYRDALHFTFRNNSNNLGHAIRYL